MLFLLPQEGNAWFSLMYLWYFSRAAWCGRDL